MVRGYGFEADLEFKPVPELLLTAGISYNNTKIRDAGLTTAACGATRVDTFPNVSLCTRSIRLSSQRRPSRQQSSTSTATACRKAPSGSSTGPRAMACPSAMAKSMPITDWAYRSKINFFLYESVEFQDKQMLEGGVRVGYKTDNYDFAAFVRNITKDTSAVGGIDFNNLTGFVNEPRIWGVEAGFKF